MKPDRLVIWDQLALRIRGSRIEALARDLLRRKKVPLSDLTLRFLEGELHVEGKVQTFLAVPFRMVIRRILHDATTVRVPLESASAFGLPIPKLLMILAQSRVDQEGIALDGATGTLIISLDRFLPNFLDVEITKISLVDGGVSILLGAGGADLPEGTL